MYINSKKMQTNKRKEDTVMEHIELIKSYLKRLGDGENLENVRNDFVKEFKDVDASEIIKAEQELLKEGTPLEEVQRLCDVHAALFHGMIRQEKKDKNEDGTEKRTALSAHEKKMAAAEQLAGIPGHPLYTFTMENKELEKLLGKCKDELQTGDVSTDLIDSLRQLAVHYAKKGDLIYPHLKVQYGISGPSDVMWTVDDEIRDELAALSKAGKRDEKWMERFKALLIRIEEMIYKEANILFPNCALNFTKEEWYGIYRDSKDYVECFGVVNRNLEDAEKYFKDHKMMHQRLQDNDGEIMMRGGHMTLEQLEAMLNTIPLEITFVDVDNVNRYFNEGPKVFKRPGMAIDREVFSCHPPKVEQQVKRIISEFRQGTMDKVTIWMNKNGKTMLVTYMAVRDRDSRYLGTIELVQDMEFAREYFKK